jgi:hypothetical protein
MGVSGFGFGGKNLIQKREGGFMRVTSPLHGNKNICVIITLCDK